MIGSTLNAVQLPSPDQSSACIVEPSSPVESALEVALPDLDRPSVLDGEWYLGLDIGTSAVSAALLERQTCQLYPVHWSLSQQAANLPIPRGATAGTWDRLPLTALLEDDRQVRSADEPESAEQPSSLPPRYVLQHFKQFLNVGLPYISSQTHTWEPELQCSDIQQVPLAWVQQALTALLTTLRANSAVLQGQAKGLAPATFQAVLNQLTGVVLNYASGWSDAYCFNLREAVLAAGLVAQPEQVFFVEETIAALLADLPRGKWYGTGGGATLVVSAGATTTEMLLVNLPPGQDLITREHLHLRSLAYAGNALNQDILCQLLYPTAWDWDRVGVQSVEFPLPGEPDLQVRHRFQQRLYSSVLGQQLLEAAQQIKQALQQHEAAELDLRNQSWTVCQIDFHSRVMLPYIQRLNRELNVLLTQTGIVAEAVGQVICTGGTASSPTIAHWLKQKLPNARIVQDSEVTPSSRIARGLAMLPMYPQVLNSDRHQYSDFFLLREMLTGLPVQPLSLGRILQMLENRGVNTQACQRSILNLLEGQLPMGLVPVPSDASLLTVESLQNPEYQSLTSLPLFSKPDSQTYCLNAEVRDRLLRYLAAILKTTHQTLEDPLPYTLTTMPRCSSEAIA